MAGPTGLNKMVRMGGGGHIAQVGACLVIGPVVALMAGNTGLLVIGVWVNGGMAVDTLEKRNGLVPFSRAAREEKEKEKYHERGSADHICPMGCRRSHVGRVVALESTAKRDEW